MKQNKSARWRTLAACPFNVTARMAGASWLCAPSDSIFNAEQPEQTASACSATNMQILMWVTARSEFYRCVANGRGRLQNIAKDGVTGAGLWVC